MNAHCGDISRIGTQQVNDQYNHRAGYLHHIPRNPDLTEGAQRMGARFRVSKLATSTQAFGGWPGFLVNR
jgi:hypothetical protein